MCSFPMRLGKISVFYLLLCFQDTLEILTLPKPRSVPFAGSGLEDLARKKARTILPSFLPSFLPSQSPTAKPSLSPTEDPTSGSSCRPGQSAARVQASFVPESDRKTVRGFYLSTYGGHSCALAVSTWQGRLPGPRLSFSCFRMRPGNMSVFYLLLCFQDTLKIFTPP